MSRTRAHFRRRPERARSAKSHSTVEQRRLTVEYLEPRCLFHGLSIAEADLSPDLRGVGLEEKPVEAAPIDSSMDSQWDEPGKDGKQESELVVEPDSETPPCANGEWMEECDRPQAESICNRESLPEESLFASHELSDLSKKPEDELEKDEFETCFEELLAMEEDWEHGFGFKMSSDTIDESEESLAEQGIPATSQLAGSDLNEPGNETPVSVLAARSLEVENTPSYFPPRPRGVELPWSLRTDVRRGETGAAPLAVAGASRSADRDSHSKPADVSNELLMTRSRTAGLASRIEEPLAQRVPTSSSSTSSHRRNQPGLSESQIMALRQRLRFSSPTASIQSRGLQLARPPEFMEDSPRRSEPAASEVTEVDTSPAPTDRKSEVSVETAATIRRFLEDEQAISEGRWREWSHVVALIATASVGQLVLERKVPSSS